VKQFISLEPWKQRIRSLQKKPGFASWGSQAEQTSLQGMLWGG